MAFFTTSTCWDQIYQTFHLYDGYLLPSRFIILPPNYSVSGFQTLNIACSISLVYSLQVTWKSEYYFGFCQDAWFRWHCHGLTTIQENPEDFRAKSWICCGHRTRPFPFAVFFKGVKAPQEDHFDEEDWPLELHHQSDWKFDSHRYSDISLVFGKYDRENALLRLASSFLLKLMFF
jgi:hypothetical protein